MAKKVNTKKQEGRPLLPVKRLKSSTTDADLAIAFTNYVELMFLLEREKKGAKGVAELFERVAARLRCPETAYRLEEMADVHRVSNIDASLLLGFDGTIRDLSLDADELRAKLVKDEYTKRLVEFLDRKAA